MRGSSDLTLGATLKSKSESDAARPTARTFQTKILGATMVLRLDSAGLEFNRHVLRRFIIRSPQLGSWKFCFSLRKNVNKF